MTTKKINPDTIINESFTKAAEDLRACGAEIEAALGEDEKGTVLNKRRSLRMRKGGERVVEVIANLAKTYELDSKGLHSDDMTAFMRTAAALAPLEALLTRLLQRVSEQRFKAQGKAYEQTLQFYALLQRRAATDGQVAASIAPIEEFFSYRHSSVLDSKPTKAQTRAMAKLTHAQKLVARARPRAATLEAEYDTAHAPPAPQPTPAVAPSVVSPAVAVPANVPAGPISTRSPSTSTSNGSSNGIANGWNPNPVPALANGQNQ